MDYASLSHHAEEHAAVPDCGCVWRQLLHSYNPASPAWQARLWLSCPSVQREMMGQVPGQETPLAYLHIDCDLYAGSKDAFTLLSHKIVPGTVSDYLLAVLVSVLTPLWF